MTSTIKPPKYRYEPASLYVVDEFYEWLVNVSEDLARPDVRTSIADVDLSFIHQVEQLLAAEARLLDQAALDHAAYTPWLSLYDEECVYWIPSSSPASDPRRSITLEFHDRRRLLDRVVRLGTGLAFSQYPTSRTSRQWTGLEIWASPGRSDEWRARCNFSIVETREGHSRVLAGWNGFVLRKCSDGLRIAVKQINLIDNDRPQGNNSFFL